MSSADDNKVARIAVVGAGWWSQGWHLPHLHRNPKSQIAAIVDASEHPKSNLNPNLEPLSALKEKYQCPTFSSVEQLFEQDPALAASLDGVIVCTPHATHSDIGRFFLQERAKPERRQKPLHILMEKPMTTNVDQAKQLYDSVVMMEAHNKNVGSFMVNHSANYISQTRVAKQLVQAGKIGEIQHITGFFASPLSWIFEDPTNKGWNEPTPGIMLGNGFGWGQSSHLLAWIYHVCGGGNDINGDNNNNNNNNNHNDLQPQRVYCTMHHSTTTGADVAVAASIKCNNGVTMSISGTSLLPGNAHSDPPVAKQIEIKIYGSHGAIHYCGDDRDPTSGRLELRLRDGSHNEGAVQVQCEDLGFRFEELDQEGTGPQSLQNFLSACLGEEDYYVGADCLVGLKSIQTLDAMYRSEASGNPEDIAY